MVCIYKPETRENLNDEEKRSRKDLVDYQEGSDEFSNCWVGNELR
jgi:hypothetical protein